MANAGRTLSVFFILIVAASLLLFPTVAADNAKPLVPEFTLRYVDNSYITPPTTTATTDPYNGHVTTSTNPGSYVENKSVQVIITNPPFTTHKDENGSDINLYYQVFFKGHFEDVWSSVAQYPGRYNLYTSDSPITVIPVPIYNISEGGQVDVKVMALVGTFVEVYEPPLWAFMDSTGVSYSFIGADSGWSDIKTITINGDSSTVTIAPYVSPSFNPSSTFNQLVSGDSVVLGLGWVGVTIVALMSVIVVLLVFVVVLLRRNPRQLPN